MRTRDAAMVNRGLTRRPKWNIPPEKRDDLLRAGYEAVEWAREQEDPNAVARLLSVYRGMEADNDRVEIQLAEWDRIDNGDATSLTKHQHLHAHLDARDPEVAKALRTIHKAAKDKPT